MVRRILHAVMSVDEGAPPTERAALEAGLKLAMRLGIPTGAMLEALLDPTKGSSFYEVCLLLSKDSWYKCGHSRPQGPLVKGVGGQSTRHPSLSN